jgi:hypothetical protein
MILAWKLIWIIRTLEELVWSVFSGGRKKNHSQQNVKEPANLRKIRAIKDLKVNKRTYDSQKEG